MSLPYPPTYNIGFHERQSRDVHGNGVPIPMGFPWEGMEVNYRNGTGTEIKY